ncbi:MAG TPA: sulfotransferase, partial [Anaerolineales bacterium]|nr:sulfotransferase [Anaerolineales bacterium]
MIDFLVIGAEKSGTTWLAGMLGRHPGVFIPPEKELFYFNERFFESPELPNFNAAQPLEWYLGFFAAAGPGQIKGEASPAYLWDEAAPSRIATFDPDLKLLAVLRDPAERAFSQYLYYIQRGLFVRRSFEDALEARPDLLTRGLYHRQLSRFLELFPPERVRIDFFDDLKADPGGFLAGVQAYLGVPAQLPGDLETPANVTGVPRFAILNRAIAGLRYPLRKYNPPRLLRFLRRTGLARLQERIR